MARRWGLVLFEVNLLFRHYHTDCPEAFRAPGKLEPHTGALLQGIEILPTQSGAVEKDILPIFCPDETKTPKPYKALSLPFQTYRLLPQDIWRRAAGNTGNQIIWRKGGFISPPIHWRKP